MAETAPLRVLFLAFGYSIHARRRIGLFAEDSGFQVHVASNHAYEIPGAEVTVLNGAEARRGISEARLDHYRRAVARLLGDNGVHEVGMGTFNSMVDEFIASRQLLRAARGFRPELVFLQTLLYPSYLSYLLPMDVPRMITFWNGDLIWWAQQTEILKAFKRRIVEMGIRKAAAITVNSQSAHDAALEYGIDPSRLHVVRYPGVDLEHFCPGDKGEARERLGLGGGPVILCPRGLGGYLNSDVLVDAACALLRHVPDARFVFLSKVGEQLWDEHMRLPRELGLETAFRHVGQVEWEAMPDYYRAADMMVSVSSNDSQPNCMLEAMACGLPVVLGDIPAIREWVAAEKNGLLVAPRDAGALAGAMLRLLRDGKVGQRFARINRAIVQERVDSRLQCGRIKELARSVVMEHRAQLAG